MRIYKTTFGSQSFLKGAVSLLDLTDNGEAIKEYNEDLFISIELTNLKVTSFEIIENEVENIILSNGEKLFFSTIAFDEALKSKGN